MDDGLDFRTGEARGQAKRVTAFTIAIARGLRLARDQIAMIARGAFLHDVGLMAIPSHILRKPGKLTEDERRAMQEHAYLGYQMLQASPIYAEISEIVYSHHERFDGSGYPRGLKGDQIPLGARIVAVSDTLEAITSDRPYRPAQAQQVALDEIERLSGRQFDPDVGKAFLAMPSQIWEDLRKEIAG
jgi:HD-GYP domain-containing protein (c-di-GMP phosphodiesterase class II)